MVARTEGRGERSEGGMVTGTKQQRAGVERMVDFAPKRGKHSLLKGGQETELLSPHQKASTLPSGLCTQVLSCPLLSLQATTRFCTHRVILPICSGSA